MEEGELEGIVGDQVIASLFDSIRMESGDSSANSLVIKRLKGFSTVRDYLARVRDFEAIVPNTNRLLNELHGSKVIVVGKSHVPFVTKAINGDHMAKPLPWDEHVSTLSQEKSKEVAAFESFARTGMRDNRRNL
jgi:hypothetical protein